MLVIVHDRDVQHLVEASLDLEALRRLDVLQLDGAESGRDDRDGANNLLGVLARQQDGHAVDTDQRIEQDRLALHHRHAGHRPDVAQAQDGRAVGHDGHGVSDRGVLVLQLWRLLDQLAHLGHARRVDLAQSRQTVERDPALHRAFRNAEHLRRLAIPQSDRAILDRVRAGLREFR